MGLSDDYDKKLVLHRLYSTNNSLEKATLLINEITTNIRALKLYNDDQLKKITFILMETLTNAIEHGNLEISSKQKAEMLSNFDDTYETFFEKRKKTEPYASRIVTVEITCSFENLEITVSDQGKGFEKTENGEPLTMDRESFRGLEMCQQYASAITFNEVGNSVTIHFNRSDM